MEPNRWKQISRICAEALERDPDKREAFVEVACEGDAELRAEVLSLLAQDCGADGILDAPPAWDGVVASELESQSFEGKSIGPYRIVRLIGRGGMGQIFLAERDDAQFDQSVALKVIRRGMDTDDILRRFRAERQILAGLAHPGIARLYDGGATEDGVPYFAMEYIDGLAITKYCDENKLTVRERLLLFKKVCAAGHYAHQNLIVHRDLKPSNILVSSEGEPKLLDFGIAKVLDSEGDAGEQTLTSQRAMTPEYASPEQIRGETITTASDIYALGVLLFELLSGELPYTGTRTAIERAICETAPVKPSTALAHSSKTTDARGRSRRLRHLRGDVDNIVLKAMRKEPERRYASLQEFADDIDRHLRDRPVTARPETLLYVARKFIGRNWIPVGLSTIAAIAVVAFAFITDAQSKRIAEQSNIVSDERDLAEEVTEFMVDLFDQADPRATRASDIRAREILDRGYERLGDLEARPGVLARLMLSMARAYEGLDDLRPAENLLRESLELAKDLPNPLERLMVQRELALVLTRMGRLDEAAELHTEALEQWRIHDSAENPFVAMQLQRLGWIEEHRGANERAEELYREAIAMLEKLLENGPEEKLDYAKTLGHLGHLLLVHYGTEQAEPVLRQSHALMIEVLSEEDPEMGLSFEQLGRLEFALDNLQAAEENFSRALASRLQLYGEGSVNVALARNEVARVQRRLGDLESAEANYRSVAETLRARLGPDHWYVVQATFNRGNTLRFQGRLDEAKEQLTDALRTAGRLRAEDHPDRAILAEPLIRLHLDQGDVADAEALAWEAWRACQASLPPGNALRLNIACLLAEALGKQDRTEDAWALLGGELDGLDPESDAAKRIVTAIQSLEEG